MGDLPERGNAIPCLQLQLLPSMISPHIHRMIGLLYALLPHLARVSHQCLQKSHFLITG